MPSDGKTAASIRSMTAADRSAVEQILHQVGNFHPGEIACAMELVDTYLNDRKQRDYLIVVAEDADRKVFGYTCWGPTPLTKGTYDLYWIATAPEVQGAGFGRVLMEYVEDQVQKEQGRMLVAETSSKESYGNTVRFYRRLNYEEASRIRDFYDAGDDKITFVKRFSR
jgi:ribosomal protein S18 acetylase RimI-like enzyme